MSRKQVKINKDENIQIEHTPIFNSTESYKDALLASLYSQVEFLRNELEEKNLLIRTLIIKESDVYNYDANNSAISNDINEENDNTENNDIAYKFEHHVVIINYY